MPYVNKRTLLIIGGMFWLIAGVNVALVGVNAFFACRFAPFASILLVLGVVAVFLVFFMRIFKPYAAKHAKRIADMSRPKAPFWEFLDRKGYLMVIFMIALGATLRLCGFVPNWFIAFFYTGLGLALAITGALFLKASPHIDRTCN